MRDIAAISNGPLSRNWLSKAVCWALVLCVLAACGVPQVGPQKLAIEDADADSLFALVPASKKAVSAANWEISRENMPSAFVNLAPWSSDLILPGDGLTVRVWENVDSPLLSTVNQSATIIEELRVSDKGTISFPYVGRLHVVGKTTSQIRELIERSLSEQTPNPQVLVNKLAGETKGIVLSGDITTPAQLPIDRSNNSLLQAIAVSGGVTPDFDDAVVHLYRGGQSASLLLSNLKAGSKYDLNLRPGDHIDVEGLIGSFVAFGAVGRQVTVEFPGTITSLTDALGLIGGLSSATADPAAVFVFRTLDNTTADRLDLPIDQGGKDNVIFAFDMRDPNGLFFARDFWVKDEDIVYVSEAPLARLQKVVSIFTSVVSSGASVRTNLE